MVITEAMMMKTASGYGLLGPVAMVMIFAYYAIHTVTHQRNSTWRKL